MHWRLVITKTVFIWKETHDRKGWKKIISSFFYLQRPCCEQERWLAGSQWSSCGAWGSAEGNLLPGRWKRQHQMPGMPFSSFFSGSLKQLQLYSDVVFQQIYCLFNYLVFSIFACFCVLLFFILAFLKSISLCVFLVMSAFFMCLVSFALSPSASSCSAVFLWLQLVVLHPQDCLLILSFFSLAQSSIRLSSGSGESTRMKK